MSIKVQIVDNDHKNNFFKFERFTVLFLNN